MPAFDQGAYRHRHIFPIPHPLILTVQDTMALPRPPSSLASVFNSSLGLLNIEQNGRSVITSWAPSLMSSYWGGLISRNLALDLRDPCESLIY